MKIFTKFLLGIVSLSMLNISFAQEKPKDHTIPLLKVPESKPEEQKNVQKGEKGDVAKGKDKAKVKKENSKKTESKK